MDTLTQLPLNIHWDRQLTFTNFFTGDNQLLVNYLQNFPQHPQESVAYLWGASGSGRTHLLQATYHLAEQQQQIAYLPLRESKQFTPNVLENLENFALVILDDLQLIVGNLAWEEAVFHLYNRLQLAQHKLLVSAEQTAQQLNFQLADLQSRFAAATIFKVPSLSESQKLAALQLRARQRGLTLSVEAAKFIMHHYRRDLPSLVEMLEKLDHASLSEKRKLTIPFLKRVLQFT